MYFSDKPSSSGSVYKHCTVFVSLHVLGSSDFSVKLRKNLRKPVGRAKKQSFLHEKYSLRPSGNSFGGEGAAFNCSSPDFSELLNTAENFEILAIC